MSKRKYARTARLNELLREILADELERNDDDRLELVTITGVEVDAGLDHAIVYFSSLLGENDEAVQEALDENRAKLQKAIARQARIRQIPRLAFRPDSGIRTGARVEEILADLHATGQISDEDEAEDTEPTEAEPPEEL